MAMIYTEDWARRSTRASSLTCHRACCLATVDPDYSTMGRPVVLWYVPPVNNRRVIMNRIEARKILGNQPKWALSNMARALQLHAWRNTVEENRRLIALRALGYKVYINLNSIEAALYNDKLAAAE